jgi:hypothetical protein
MNVLDVKLRQNSRGTIEVARGWLDATFECDGRKAEFGPGGYNYMPARMVHNGT